MADKKMLPEEVSAYKQKLEGEIAEIQRVHCANCEAPSGVGPDWCDTCEHGQKLGNRYWILRMMDSEYGA